MLIADGVVKITIENMDRKKLNTRLRVLNFFFTVKIKYHNDIYIVFRPLYKEYIKRIFEAVKVLLYRFRRVVIKKNSTIVNTIILLAAIATIMGGVVSLLTWLMSKTQ